LLVQRSLFCWRSVFFSPRCCNIEHILKWF
jgi:hypothetical protein